MSQQDMMESLSTYYDLMTTNGKVRVFGVFMQMGIFNSMMDGPSTVKEIAKKTGLLASPLSDLLNCLVPMGLIQRQGDTITPQPILEFFTDYYSDLSDSYWDHLPQYLKTGEPFIKMDDESVSEQAYLKQAGALGWMMQPAAAYLAQILTRKIPGANIIDIGAGSGVWSLGCLQQDSEAQANLIDWQGVLKIAEVSGQKMGVADRVKLISGNYHEVDFPSEQNDIAIIGNVAHLETPERLQSLLEKTKTHIKPGGLIAIVDVFDSQEQGKIPKALYQMGLSLRTANGYAYSENELKAIALDAGFGEMEFEPLKVIPFTMGALLLKV